MAKLLGGGKGKSQGGRPKGGLLPPNVNPVNPSQSGNADVVQQRNAQMTQGAMLQKAKSKSKSTGMKVPKK
jgi:hypothetical protein